VTGLIVFGTIADRSGSFEIAALVTFLPIVPALYFLSRLPETRGVSLEGTLGSEMP